MTSLPAYNTHPIRCAAPRCKWEGLEGQRIDRPLNRPGTIKASESVCPRCGCNSYEFLSETKAWHWRRNQARCAYGLSPMQLTVLRTIADGKGQKAAAQKLNLSVAALRDHVKQAFNRMGCNSIERAILLAERAGLLKEVA